MKKDIGNSLALYPTPLAVVGTMIAEKPNWVLVAHLGIIGHDRIMISLAKSHYTNTGIKASNKLSVAIVNEEILPKADYVGMVSGAKTDKSQVFDYSMGKAGTPVIDAAPVVMECEVVDVYETEGFESFICSIAHVYAEETVLSLEDKIDYRKLKPVLFEMPTYEYLRTGEVIGKCRSFSTNDKK